MYPGVGSLSSEVALVSIDSCNKPANNFSMSITISPNTKYYHIGNSFRTTVPTLALTLSITVQILF